MVNRKQVEHILVHGTSPAERALAVAALTLTAALRAVCDQAMANGEAERWARQLLKEWEDEDN